MLADEDPYIDRRRAFLKAALPPSTDDVGIEHTFAMFLRNYQGPFEKRLQGKLSRKGSDCLLKAALSEHNYDYQDYSLHQKLMDFLVEQVPVDDSATAAELIVEAYTSLYQSKRKRYELLLGSLSSGDRAVIKSEFFDRLSFEIGPLPNHPTHYRFRMMIEIPGKERSGIKRECTFFMARGVPNWNFRDSGYEGCIGWEG